MAGRQNGRHACRQRADSTEIGKISSIKRRSSNRRACESLGSLEPRLATHELNANIDTLEFIFGGNDVCLHVSVGLCLFVLVDKPRFPAQIAPVFGNARAWISTATLRLPFHRPNRGRLSERGGVAKCVPYAYASRTSNSSRAAGQSASKESSPGPGTHCTGLAFRHDLAVPALESEACRRIVTCRDRFPISMLFHASVHSYETEAVRLWPYG
jgi:hypothetical protein